MQPKLGRTPGRVERWQQLQEFPWHKTGRVSSNVLLLKEAASKVDKPKVSESAVEASA